MAKTILVVDDEATAAAVFETALKSLGHMVILAENGQRGIEILKANKVDLVLLDQMMPGMSGNDTLKAIKADEALKNIPIAMLTNFGHEEVVKEALANGAEDYILKYQISPDDLARKVEALIG